METYSSDQEEGVSFSSDVIDLSERLREIPQDRLIEEIIALWDEVNNLELELIKNKRRNDGSKRFPIGQDRSVVVDYEEKIRVANIKITRLENQLHNEKVIRESFEINIEKINADTTLPDNTILVTLDVKSLYTVIPQSEGVECVEDALSEREEKDVPSAFIARLLELLLKYNIFEFNGDFFQQIIGTAMGSKPAPPYANIFMSRKIDNPIMKKKEMRIHMMMLIFQQDQEKQDLQKRLNYNQKI